MNINFPNKKIPFKIVIIVLLIFVGVIGAIFYWQKTHIPPVPPDISSGAECLEEAGKMTDQELIEEINTLTTDFATEEYLPNINKQMFRYLICKLKENKDEEIYNLAKNFTEGFQEESRQNSLVWLDEVYSQEPYNSFTINLALGELAEICPNELSKYCLNRKRTSGAPVFEEWCLNICNDINEYPKNPEKFNEEIIGFDDWNSDLNYMFGQYTWRSAMAFRLGGKDLALKICDNLMESEKDNCQKKIEEFEDLRVKGVSECVVLRDNLEEAICELY